MKEIEKKYIVDDQNRKIAVQLDISIFEKIENILEDHGLFNLINEDDKSDYLTKEEAKKFYDKLDKAN
ncbi:MAG: hypothetical protein A3B68_05600 [Candidatus Melainabacteria bacterium RIFCSPHIGHO2_02_FULL_34_12]|nr:MAG: hypothetical protein A3B68_05600 [Candidatus Melainabacteria bacterium RIFCSPHIGHO2_02_FULL_34_12]